MCVCVCVCVCVCKAESYCNQRPQNGFRFLRTGNNDNVVK